MRFFSQNPGYELLLDLFLRHFIFLDLITWCDLIEHSLLLAPIHFESDSFLNDSTTFVQGNAPVHLAGHFTQLFDRSFTSDLFPVFVESLLIFSSDPSLVALAQDGLEAAGPEVSCGKHSRPLFSSLERTFS